MLLSKLQKKLNKYDTDPDVGRGRNRRYGAWFTGGGDCYEIKCLRKFLTATLVGNNYKNVDVTFLDFMDYLVENKSAHIIEFSALYYPGSTRASVNLVFKPWFDELSKKEKIKVRNMIGDALVAPAWYAFWSDNESVESLGGPYHRLYM